MRKKHYERSGYLTRLNTRLSTRLGSSLVSAGGAAAPSLPNLNAQFGDRLLSWYHITGTDDSTLGLVSGALDTWANRSTGADASGTLTALGASNRPLVHATGGPLNEAHVSCVLASDGSTARGMSGAFTPPASNRWGVYYLASEGFGASGVQPLVTIWDGVATASPRSILGSTGASPSFIMEGTQQRIRNMNTSGTQSTVLVTDPPMTRDWRLTASLCYSVSDGGWTSEVNGALTTPESAVTTAHLSGATTINVGTHSTSKAGARVKAIVILADPTPADTTWLEDNYFAEYVTASLVAKHSIILAGQSNAAFARPALFGDNGWIDETHIWWDTPAQSATTLAVDWAPASTLRTKLINTVADTPLTGECLVIWNQGEHDSDNATYAAAYEANLDALLTDIWAVRADARILLCLQPSWQTYTYKADVNTAKTNIAALYPSLVETMNMDDVTPSGDNIHYSDPVGIVEAIEKYRAYIIAEIT